MKRIISAMLLLLLLMGCAGCADTPKAGIGHVGEKAYYTIRMTTEERESYFSTADPVNKIAVTHYGETGSAVINWSPVSGGGWIAWIGDRVRYAPEGFTGTELKTAFSTLTRESSAMSIQTAAKYVPQLGDS